MCDPTSTNLQAGQRKTEKRRKKIFKNNIRVSGQNKEILNNYKNYSSQLKIQIIHKKKQRLRVYPT